MYLATRLRPSFSLVPPFQAEGAGNAACWQQPMARLQKKAGGSHHRFSRKQPAFPARWFTSVLRALPGEPAVLPPSLGCSSKHIELGISTGMPGPHGFAVRDRIV